MFYIVVLLLFFLSFLRWERGTDWDSYYNIFINEGFRSWDDHTEIGYLYLNKLVRKFTDNYTIFLFVQSFIYFTILVLFLKKINSYISYIYNIKSNLYSTILLYIFSTDFAGLFLARSPIAYLICLYSIFDIIENRTKSFFFKILIASLIHKSSILFIFIYPLINYFKFNIRYIIILSIFIVILFSLSSYYSVILDKLGMIDYFDYIGNERRNSIISIIKWLLIFLLMIISLKKIKSNDFLFNSIVLIYPIGFILFIWSQIYSTVAQRIAGLFLITTWIFIPYLFNFIYKKNILVYFLFIIFCILNLWSQLNGAYSKLYVPFKFVWDNFYVETF